MLKRSFFPMLFLIVCALGLMIACGTALSQIFLTMQSHSLAAGFFLH